MVKIVDGSKARSKVTFEVDNDRLETVVGLLIRETTNFCVTGIDEPEVKRRPKKVCDLNTEKYNVVGADVLQLMKQNPLESYHYKQLGFLMPKHGYRETSISAILSALISEGKIVRAGRGMYRLAQ